MAAIFRGLRAGVRPRDLLGRVQLLLLALAEVNALAVLIVVAATDTSPALYALGLVAAVGLGLTWLWVYRHHDFSIAADIAVIATICVFSAIPDSQLNYVVAA